MVHENKMPACSENYRFSRCNSDLCSTWSSRCNGSNPCSPKHGSSPLSPSSPLSSSPKFISAIPTLRRSMSSTFSLIPEERTTPEMIPEKQQHGFLFYILLWFPVLAYQIIQAVVGTLMQLAWGQIFLVLPTLWIAAYLWVFWKFVQFPYDFVKWIIRTVSISPLERNRKKKTVIINSGSTIQALHLARNFYSSGTRVVAIEIEGLFGLAKFSTAVDKFYTIPRPSVDNPNDYVHALCNIVEIEKANYYVPVSATSSAYFDALAKPHLEILGCSCFVPNVKDVMLLDDIAEVLHRCQEMTKPTPMYTNVSSKDDVNDWYNNNGIPHGTKHFMASTGSLGIKERIKFIMPTTKSGFRLNREISDQRPWVIVQDLPGDHFLTCTTVKDSQIVANVTCKIDPKSKGLVHQLDKEIEAWLKQFFAKLCVSKPITGHVSFRFVRDSATKIILPLGAKVGVSLPYICHNSVHPKLLWKPCPHFNRQKSGPAIAASGNYWMHEVVLNTLRHPGLEAVSKLIGTVLDKREALFVFWDPLPYCAYYQLQLPISSVLKYIQNRREKEVPRLQRRLSHTPSSKLMIN